MLFENNKPKVKLACVANKPTNEAVKAIIKQNDELRNDNLLPAPPSIEARLSAVEEALTEIILMQMEV